MTKAYWVGHVNVHDMSQYKKYIEANAEPFAKYGAKFLVRGGKHEVREGQMNDRIVVLEFKDYETAVACYDSPEYQAAMKYRLDHSDGSIVIIEGWDG